jgi:hypothetical protein
MSAALRVASTSVDTLRKRERQVMAAAYDLAMKGGAFSISFVAKRTSVKALIYLSAPKGASGHLEAEEPEDVVDEAGAEEGGRVMPSSAKEQHRARREANPAAAQPTAAKRTPGQPNGINVQCAQKGGSSSTAAKGPTRPKARVDRNALSARSDGASKRPLSPAAVSTDSTVRMNVRQCQDVDTMEQEESASLGAPGTQEDDRARLLAWAARPPGIPDPDDPGPPEGLSEWDAGPYGLGGYG